MDRQTWEAVDDYIAERLVGEHKALSQALVSSAEAGLPSIAVSAAQGKFLHLVARIKGVKRILELGTLGGYSAIWLARALPEGGELVTLEFDPRHADVARKNLEAAGLAQKVRIIVGPAIESLPSLTGFFDLVFIDANKDQMKEYLEWAVRLTQPGAVIICDNVVRDGQVVQHNSADANIQGVRATFDLMHEHPGLDSTALQTVGAKHYDGFALSLRV